jgi:NADH-quinone oxidoreductase subunit N
MNWILFGPELYLFVMTAVFFGFSVLGRPNPRRDFLTALVMAAAGVVMSIGAVGLQGTLFAGVYRVDLFSQAFKVILVSGLFLVISLCSELRGIREDRHPEFYLLLSLCTLAMTIMVSSVELLTLYIALELTSYSLYILVALRKGSGFHTEAGIKYFLLGFHFGNPLFGLAFLWRSRDLWWSS